MSTPTNKRYPVNTLQEMAAIPEDRLPEFLEELPEILRMVRLHKGLVLDGKCTWVDEDAHMGMVKYSDLDTGEVVTKTSRDYRTQPYK